MGHFGGDSWMQRTVTPESRKMTANSSPVSVISTLNRSAPVTVSIREDRKTPAKRAFGVSE